MSQNVFSFSNSEIKEIKELIDRLKSDKNYQNNVLKMLNTVLGIKVNFNLLIKFLQNHIQKERLRKV